MVLGFHGFFCFSLTGAKNRMSKFLDSWKVQVYGCASRGTSYMYLLLKMQKLTPTIPLVLLKIIPVSTKESWHLLGRITVKCNSISVCQVFSLLEMCDGLGGSESLGDCSAGIRVSWTWAEGGLAFSCYSSPSFCSFLPGLYPPIQSVFMRCYAFQYIFEMFVSAEPAAIVQFKSSWSELGLELQGGLLGS